MDAENRQKNIRVVGIYIIIILALLRSLVYPLHGAVEKRKALLAEQTENLRLQSRIIDRQGQARPAGAVVDGSEVLPYLYDSQIRTPQIQAEVIEEVVKAAEKRGLLVLNFEMPEAVVGKKVTEAPVRIRLSGKPEAFRELLVELSETKKILSVKTLEINSLSGQGLSYMLVVSAFRVEK